MKEEWVDKKAELLNMLNCIEGNHLVDCDEKATKYTEKCCDAIRKLIEDIHAYDERVDEIVKYYRRQDSEAGRITTLIEGLAEVRFVRHIESHLSSGQIPCCKICGKTIFEITGDSEPKVVDEETANIIDNLIGLQECLEAGEDWCSVAIIAGAIELLSQKPRDYEQNLTDCTEAIDALIEERDALIEDLEQKRVVTKEKLMQFWHRIISADTPIDLGRILEEEFNIEVI